MAEILFTDETEAARYVIETLGEDNVVYYNKHLYVRDEDWDDGEADPAWLTNKKEIHRFLIARLGDAMTKWLTRISRFNMVYHMLTVLRYSRRLPN